MFNSSRLGFEAKSPRSWLLTKTIFLLFAVAAILLLIDDHFQGPSGNSQIRLLRREKSVDNSSEPSYWQPKAGIKWQIQLESSVEDTSIDAEVFDLDLFDNTAETISALQKQQTRVICYFSAGTYENWRPDADKFSSSDLGSALEDWEGERWLDIKSDDVRSVLTARLDLAKKKGCDGVDPDNVDAYDNENGLGLTEADSVDLMQFLASEAHDRGMSIGLKNGGDLIGAVIDQMQWSVNEQCAEYDECDTYAAFTKVDKPVFHIEYSDDSDSDVKANIKASITSQKKSEACQAAGTKDFSTVIKDLDLDEWVKYC